MGLGKLRLSDFDYHLPPELIAQRPAERRDGSRLLVLHRENGRIEHRQFGDIVLFLKPDDLLVLNATKVIPARLLGRKSGSGGQAELLLLRRRSDKQWECLVKPGRRLMPGARIEFAEGPMTAEILENQGRGRRLVSFDFLGDFFGLLDRAGHVPLPPYIGRGDEPEDRERYQTVYARDPGSVAAPTAGLHFTPEILERAREKGVGVLEVVLHVGWGTFKEVEAVDIRQHRMEEEYYRIDAAAAEEIYRARDEGRRIVAVGTTAVRALESFARSGKHEGWTEIFIHPPCGFNLVGALVTNFHLPRSTLLMLVSALAGVENIRKSYAEAIREGYRFYSYGDAMLII